MRWKFKIGIFLLITMWYATAHAQPEEILPEKLDSLQKIQPRKVFFLIGANWCKYCEMMQQTTLKNKQVVATLNNSYYLVNFDAETKRIIKFHNKIFNYQPTGNNVGVHQLAEEIGTVEGKISYPTICILNDKFEITFQYNQFVTARDLLKILGELK